MNRLFRLSDGEGWFPGTMVREETRLMALPSVWVDGRLHQAVRAKDTVDIAKH